MDDHHFDRIIKEKLDHYEDPSFDPAALADFHDKLGAFAPVPWYEQRMSHYRVAASLTFFALINAYLFWPTKDASSPAPTVQQNVSEQRVIDSLSNVIKHLESEKQLAVHQRDSSFVLTKNLNKQIAIISSTPTPVVADKKLTSKVSIGLISSLPPHLYNVLMEKGLLIAENEEAYLAAPETVNQHYRNMYLASRKTESRHLWPELVLPEFKLKPVEIKEAPIAARETKHQVISAKMRNELERHYFKGLGINIAPHADLAQGVFSQGTGFITPRAGVIVDWVVSPRFSVESGIDYSTTRLALDKNFQTITLPSSDTSLGRVERLGIKHTLVSAPVALKYRQWLSEKTQSFIKIGYTPYFSVKQEYRFEYDFDQPPGPYPSYPYPNPRPDHDRHVVTSVQETKNNGYYGGTGTISLGLTRLIKNKHKVEASLFYEKSLASVGQEKLGMQLFGVRSAYWFTLR